jgi:hypothetical protein
MTSCGAVASSSENATARWASSSMFLGVREWVPSGATGLERMPQAAVLRWMRPPVSGAGERPAALRAMTRPRHGGFNPARL